MGGGEAQSDLEMETSKLADDSLSDVEMELEDMEYMPWLVELLRSMQVKANINQMVVVEDEILKKPWYKQELASTPIKIGEDDWRNVSGVNMEVVKFDAAKYIPDIANLPRWAPNHFKP